MGVGEGINTVTEYRDKAILKVNESNMSAEQKLTYLIPTILDIELYYLYYSNRDRCLDLIFKLIEANDNIDFRKYIKDSGSILNQHSKQYIKEIKRDIK